MFSSLLLAAVIISATPQEHQVENVINPKTVDLTVLERGPGHASMKLVPTDGGADGSRLVTLIVPNNDDGRVKLSNTIKTRDRMKPLVLGPNRKFLVYTIPFEDLQDAAKLKELAKENKHLTASQAAEIAKKAKCKRLILTHISQRYQSNEKILLEEARKIFKNTDLAEDLMVIEV